jgi:hypothetical protein
LIIIQFQANGLLPRLALLSAFINTDCQIPKYKVTYNKYVKFSLLPLKEDFVILLHRNVYSELLKIWNHLWTEPDADEQRSPLIQKILFASVL